MNSSKIPASSRSRRGLCSLLILLIYLVIWIRPLTGLAARPFVTDDSRISGAKQIQLETWLGWDSQSAHHWAILSYYPLDTREIGVGFVHGFADGAYTFGLPL